MTRALRSCPTTCTFCSSVKRVPLGTRSIDLTRLRAWIFEPAGIADELDAYNPLIPDGTNWKVTLLIEFPDPVERQAALVRLRGVERHCYVHVAGFDRVHAIADEDLERENEDKTSAVHWLRFELTPAMRTALRDGAELTAGCDLPACTQATTLSQESREALLRDLD